MVGPKDDLFSLEVHYGGFFCGLGSIKWYMDGRIGYVDQCKVNTWSPLWIKGIVEELVYDMSNVGVY